MTTDERFMADMASALVESTLDHMSAVALSTPDPETTPDQEFAGLSIPEIWEILDEYQAEKWAWFHQYN